MSSTVALDPDKRPIVPLRFTNLDQLYKSYMPFFRNGGVFIPTRKRYSMGQEVLVVIVLPEVEDKFQVKGYISWVTPKDSTSHVKQGIGVEFSDSLGMALRNRIEGMLADRQDSDAPTYTL